MWRFGLLWVVACSGSEKPAVTNGPPAEQHRGVLRIDAAPAGKDFQGVWLERAGGSRWLLAYRASEMWRGFEDREVIVTGHCYGYPPHVQQMSGTHFRVERLRFFQPERGRGPLLEIGPAEYLIGKFVDHPFPAGTKRAGTTSTRFVAGGTAYWIAGSERPVPAPADADVRVRARRVEPDLSFAAQPGGPNLWLFEVGSKDHDEELPIIPCPS